MDFYKSENNWHFAWPFKLSVFIILISYFLFRILNSLSTKKYLLLWDFLPKTTEPTPLDTNGQQIINDDECVKFVNVQGKVGTLAMKIVKPLIMAQTQPKYCHVIVNLSTASSSLSLHACILLYSGIKMRMIIWGSEDDEDDCVWARI